MSSGTRGRRGLARAMDRGGTERPPEARCVKSGGGADRCICASCNRVRAANRRQDTKWEARRDGVCRPATQHCVGLKGCRLSRGACHRRIASWGAVLFVLCSICLPRCASPVSHERDWSEPALHSQLFFLWSPFPSQDVAIVCMRRKHDFACPLVTA